MECEERLKKIVDGFQKNRNAFSAIGDDTRQLILLVLLESDLSGIRVGEIAQKNASDKTFCIPSPSDPQRIRYRRNAERRNKKLLLFECRGDAVEGNR